jgi:hypothetical protein
VTKYPYKRYTSARPDRMQRPIERAGFMWSDAPTLLLVWTVTTCIKPRIKQHSG